MKKFKIPKDLKIPYNFSNFSIAGYVTRNKLKKYKIKKGLNDNNGSNDGSDRGGGADDMDIDNIDKEQSPLLPRTKKGSTDNICSSNEEEESGGSDGGGTELLDNDDNQIKKKKKSKKNIFNIQFGKKHNKKKYKAVEDAGDSEEDEPEEADGDGDDDYYEEENYNAGNETDKQGKHGGQGDENRHQIIIKTPEKKNRIRRSKKTENENDNDTITISGVVWKKQSISGQNVSFVRDNVVRGHKLVKDTTGKKRLVLVCRLKKKKEIQKVLQWIFLFLQLIKQH